MKYLFPGLLIGFSLICIGSFYLVLSHLKEQRHSPSPIRLIAQTGPIKEGLKTEYLAEILGLCVDQPKPLSPMEAEAILKKHPLIKKVAVSYWSSDTLYIDYTLRSPVFILGDFENVGVDSEGFVFPLRPYFTPKKLPELYVGMKEKVFFGHPLKKKERDLAMAFLTHFKENLKRIDLSKSQAASLGRREIVLIVEPVSGMSQVLRLAPKRYQEGLQDYERLKAYVPFKEGVIDLRIPNLAYLSAS